MSNRAPEPAVSVTDLRKAYRLGRVTLNVLRGLSFRVEEGEFVAIVGASGSGKSTLLHLIGLLDEPDRGEVLLAGADTGRMSPRRRNRIRCRDVGFVFQFYHLLPELTVLENALLPAMVEQSLGGWPARRKERHHRAREVLQRVGLGERLRHRPKELSGGERQRVAIARALMNRPRLLLADEPTGNLDSATGRQIMQLFTECNRQGQTIVMVTHDAALAAEAGRTLLLKDGRLRA